MLQIYSRFADGLAKQGNTWLVGLGARLTFLSVLFFYFWDSAKTKVGEGFAGLLEIQEGAYYQILSEATIESYDYDTANLPWYFDTIVYAGTYMEFLLPILIVIGLFTRLAALGMIGFIVVQSFVDIVYHDLAPKAQGMFFDKLPDGLIMDQRLLWGFIFFVLLIKGAGKLSLDAILAGLFSKSPRP